jgi:hypothetical protein
MRRSRLAAQPLRVDRRDLFGGLIHECGIATAG